MSEKFHQQIVGSKSVPDLAKNYTEALMFIAVDHKVVLAGLIDWVSGYQLSGLSLEEYLRVHAQKIGDTISDSSKEVQVSFDVVPEVLDGLSDFSATDKVLLARTQRPGVNIAQAKMLIRHNASDSQTAKAMLATMDTSIMGSALHASKNFEQSRQTMRNASSDEAQQAMRVVLDNLIFKVAMNPGTKVEKSPAKISSYASSMTAADAMRSALDKRVFDALADESSSTARARQILEIGSNATTRTILAAEVLNLKSDDVYDYDTPDAPIILSEIVDNSNVVDLARFRASKKRQ